jgi:hypothetical protein
MTRWQKWLAGTVCLVAVPAAVLYWTLSDLTDPIQRQLDALRRGDLRAAYTETSAGFRGKISFEKFSDFVKEHPSLSHTASYSFTSRSADFSGTGSVKGTLTDERGAVRPAQYGLVKENKAWKILAIHLDREK